MASHAKAARQLRAKAQIATFQLKDLAAAVAAEMMVVRLAGDLIPKRFPGHGDGGEPVTLQ